MRFRSEIKLYLFRPLNPFGGNSGFELNPYLAYSKSSYQNFKNQRVRCKVNIETCPQRIRHLRDGELAFNCLHNFNTI